MSAQNEMTVVYLSDCQPNDSFPPPNPRFYDRLCCAGKTMAQGSLRFDKPQPQNGNLKCVRLSSLSAKNAINLNAKTH